MNYVTDDTMNAYLRSVQPMYDGVLGEIQKEAIAAEVPIVPPEVARLLSVLLTMLKDARVNIKRMGLEDKIKILEGDAADILPTLEGPYDVIFMDAAKGQYQAFLPHCLRLLPVGGLLIVDDVLQGGTIAQTRFSVPRRQRTIHKRLRNFLWEITHHDALETSIIPIGDGVALCYKKKEIIPETKTEGETKNAE